MVFHRDDEGEAEFLRVGLVQLGEGGAFLICQRIQPGGGLFGGRLRRQPLRRRQFPGKVRVGLQHDQAAVRVRLAEHPAKQVVDARHAVMGAAQLQHVGVFGDPGGMFEDAAECGDEPVARHFRRAVERLGRMSFQPVAGDVDAPGDPDVVMIVHIIEETAKGLNTAWPPDKTAMKPDGHHLRRARRALGVKAVETVLQIGKKLIA